MTSTRNIPWKDAVRAMNAADALGVDPLTELNAFMRGVDRGYSFAIATRSCIQSIPDKDLNEMTGFSIGAMLALKSIR